MFRLRPLVRPGAGALTHEDAGFRYAVSLGAGGACAKPSILTKLRPGGRQDAAPSPQWDTRLLQARIALRSWAGTSAALPDFSAFFSLSLSELSLSSLLMPCLVVSCL